MYDPINLSEGLFAIANVLTFAKLCFYLPISQQLGPLQITLGKMINVNDKITQKNYINKHSTLYSNKGYRQIYLHILDRLYCVLVRAQQSLLVLQLRCAQPSRN